MGPHAEGDAEVGDKSGEMSGAQYDTPETTRERILQPTAQCRQGDSSHGKTVDEQCCSDEQQADTRDGAAVGTGEIEGRIVDEESREKSANKKRERRGGDLQGFGPDRGGHAHDINREFGNIAGEMTHRSARFKEQPDVGEGGAKREAAPSEEDFFWRLHLAAVERP